MTGEEKELVGEIYLRCACIDGDCVEDCTWVYVNKGRVKLEREREKEKRYNSGCICVYMRLCVCLIMHMIAQ